MRIFLTGATGFIGTALIPELLAAGHTVAGLTRSERGAAALRAAGAEPVAGDLADLEGLRRAAAAADAVVHAGFNHDFSRFAASCEEDRAIIAALSEGLSAAGGRLVVTSGTAVVDAAPGESAREDDPLASTAHLPRAATDEAARAAAARGGDVVTVRLSQVHDPVKQGLVTELIALARARGVSRYVEGAGSWSAVHVGDAARLYRAALERGESGRAYHAVDEEAVPLPDIARTVGEILGLPSEAVAPEDATVERFGWLTHFVVRDMRASSAATRAALDWRPSGPGLLADLRALRTVAQAR